MLKQVGNVKSVPKPNSKVVQEALSLLSVLGGKKEAKNLLDEMLEAQKHNEQLIETAKTIIADAERRDKEADEKEVALQKRIRDADKNIKRRADELDNLERANNEQLEQERAKLRLASDEIKEREDALERQLVTNTEQLDKEKAILAEKEDHLVEREQALQQAVEELNDKLADYEQNSEKLSAEWSRLEEFRQKLEERDARVRAAMEVNGD